MIQKMSSMGKQSKYSALSVVSLLAVLLLHLIHWLSTPFLMGAASKMHSHHHDLSGSGSSVMTLLMLALVIANLISMYLAVRQLAMAWKKREGSRHHSYLCTGVSLVVLGMGIYTTISL
ncbi:hypothetical protein [Paenibacillus beijingensis]|uniref:Uncharacterized protein n=1 Tax=Paenibacillus beijingensis TaxID=1126833 RepID=A0A0D5NDK7_9BACL|nr:hypothetical protein [Paenibacillus beijingensis]AJY73479.1 hypothetical protein VN24_01130 [Paenibacillus beijingensis]